MAETSLQTRFRKIIALAVKAEPYIKPPMTLGGLTYSDRCVLEFLEAVRELPTDVREFLGLEE